MISSHIQDQGFDQLAFSCKPSNLTLSSIGVDFYPKMTKSIASALGHDSGLGDYQSVVEMLNHTLCLGLDNLDQTVFRLLLSGLSLANRFGSDLNIEGAKGENSGVHSCHAAITAIELIRRTGLLSPDKINDHIIEIARTSALCALVHDLGESLGELSSLADRIKDPTIVEDPETERRIFNIFLQHAYHCVLQGPGHQLDYYSVLAEMRNRSRVNPTDKKVSYVLAIKEIERQEQYLSNKSFSSEIENRIKYYMQLFDMCEIRKCDDDNNKLIQFIGLFTKVSEHIQGTRQILRFGAKHTEDMQPNLFNFEVPKRDYLIQSQDRAIPLRFCSNYRMFKNASYMEAEISQLLSVVSSKDQESIAAVTRDAVYLVMAEWFSVSRPIVSKSDFKKDDYLEGLQDELEALDISSEKSILTRGHIRSYLEYQLKLDSDSYRLQEARSSNATDTVLPEYINREQLRALYLEAYRVKYKPTHENPLYLQEEIPLELRNYKRNLGVEPESSYRTRTLFK